MAGSTHVLHTRNGSGTRIFSRIIYGGDETCAIQDTLHQPSTGNLRRHLVTDRIELQRLILQVERDVCAHANLRTLLAAADATVVRHRQELRTVKARIKRDSTKPPGVSLGGAGIHQEIDER